MNISVAYLVRSVGALVTILAGTIAVPTTVAVFTLPLPYLVCFYKNMKRIALTGNWNASQS